MRFQYGVWAAGADLIVDDMRISENRYDGINVAIPYGTFARIVNSTITYNPNYGILCVTSCHIEGNYIAANGIGVGIVGGSLLGNTIQGNTGTGIAKSGSGSAGYGNNTILNNGISVIGTLLPLHPNACSPAC